MRTTRMITNNNLLGELNRIHGMLGTAMRKKKNKATSKGAPSGHRTPERDADIELLRRRLQEQEVASTMRKADSSFLQSQLNEKER